MNPFRLSPPKMKMAKITNKVDNHVVMVLPIVLEIESLNNWVIFLFLGSLRYSLILSKIITVSLIQYPKTVRIAAMKS